MIHTKDLMVLAEANKHHENEVNRRCAVHNSYYAVYHFALQLAQDLGIDINQRVENPQKKGREIYGTHRKLSVLLVQYGIQQKNAGIRQLGQRLKSLHQNRCDADYKLNLESKFCNQQVGRHVLDCAQLLSLHQPVTSN